MTDNEQVNNSPFSRYTKIEMRKSPNGYLKWILGVILLGIVVIALWLIK